MSPRTKDNSRRIHNIHAVIGVTAAGLIWLFLSRILDRPEFLYLFTLAFAAELAIIAVARLGYAHDALIVMTGLCWVVLPICFFFTDPEENINWVFGFGGRRQTKWHPVRQLALTMIGFPLLVYLPTHVVLTMWGRSG